MAINLAKERWSGKLNVTTFGTGDQSVKVGGESTLPYLQFEGAVPHLPLAALEISDLDPSDEWPEILKNAWPGVLADPVAWAKKSATYGSDFIALFLDSAHPDKGDRSAEELAQTAKAVAEATELPLMVIGCGVPEKDAIIFPAVAEALAGRNCLIGCAAQENYSAIVASAMVNGHNVVASSPLDINLCKQLNILITEMNLPAERIVIEPLIGALGYGIEYAWSIVERSRLGAKHGEKSLAMPSTRFRWPRGWKLKRHKDEEAPEGQIWGDQATRALLWEVMTATTLLQAGGSILTFRHPEALKRFKQSIAEISKASSY